MSEANEDDTAQPVTWRHKFSNELHGVMIQIAVIAENQRSGKDQGDRIEKVLTALHTRLDNLDQRTAHLERDIEVKIQNLDNKIARIDERYATPRNIVFAMVGLILVAFIGGLIALVFKK